MLKEVGGAALIRAIKMVAQGQPILDNYLSTVYQQLDVRRRSEATARYLRNRAR